MKILILFFAVLAASAQTTVINGSRTIVGEWNASGAAGTIPFKVGTAAPSSGDCDASGEEGRVYLRTGDPASVPTQAHGCFKTGASSWSWHPLSHKVGTVAPATCVVGDAFFDSDATAGQNWLGCTATNTWTLMSGSASFPFTPSRETTSTTNDTIRINCDVAPYCTQFVNGVAAHTTTADITFQLSGGATGNAVIYYDPATQTYFCGENTAATATRVGCSASTESSVPAGMWAVGKPSGIYSFTQNGSNSEFADPTTTGFVPFPNAAPIVCDTSIDCTKNATTGETLLGVSLLVPKKEEVGSNSFTSGTTTNSGNNYTLDIGYTLSNPNNNYNCVTAKWNATNSGTATLAVEGATALEVWQHNGTSAAAAVPSGGLISGQNNRLCANASLGGAARWVCHDCGGGGGSGFDAITTGTNTAATTTWGSGASLVANAATRTAPSKSGTSPPGTCTVGDTFIDTDAAAEEQFLICTATNVWTAQTVGPISPPIWFPLGKTNQASAAVANAANAVYVVAFSVPVNTTVSKTGFYIGTGCSSCNTRVGIYNAAGDTLLATTAVLTDGGTPNMGTTGGKQANFTAPVTLVRGNTYLWAIGGDSSTLLLWRYFGSSNAGVGEFIEGAMISGNGKSGTVSGTMSGSGGSIALPSSVGTVTSFNERVYYFALGN